MHNALFTLCAATAAGVFLLSIASRLGIPAIVFWLAGGVLLGPEGLGFIGPEALGPGMKIVVGLSVAVILFEGGLTLDVRTARRSLMVIWRILSIGVLVTWLGASATIYLIFRPSPSIAVLCGSLLIVTGPTVVAPILRRINVRDHLKNILYWESVLVDAIGVFLAVLCFEWITPDQTHGTWSPLLRFATRLGLGVGIGVVAGMIIVKLLRTNWVRDEHANIVVLALALFTYASSEAVLHEAGVLSVIVAGFCVALNRPPQLSRIKRFKLELTELCVGTLFVLLAGTLRVENFQAFGMDLVVAIAILSFVVRPIAMIFSTRNGGFSLQEVAFLSWVAPRGIVAAFLASLFSLKLVEAGGAPRDSLLIHTFTFAVIGATVIVQGMTAPIVAKLLGLQKEPRKTWLIVGDTAIVEALVVALSETGVPAFGLLRAQDDTEYSDNDKVLRADPLNLELLDDPRFSDVAAVLSISSNLYFNELVCERWSRVVGQKNCYHWSDSSLSKATGHPFVGSPVLAAVGTPTSVASRHGAGLLAVEARSLAGSNWESIIQTSTPIFQIRKQGAAIVEAGSLPWSEGDMAVVARPRVRGLAGLVQSAIVVPPDLVSLDGVLRLLLEHVASRHADLPLHELHASIMERERSMSTAMGAGVMIPHAYHAGIESTECFVASVPAGIAVDTPDGEPLRLIFLVLSPSGNAGAHLGALAAIAGLCGDADYLRLLGQEKDAEALRELLLARQ